MSEILRVLRKNEASLRRYLVRFSSDSHEIDDIIQETFIRAFGVELKRKINEPRAYLFKTAKSVAIDKIRKNKNARTEPLEDSGLVNRLIDENQFSAEEWLDGRRKLAFLAEAVAQLPPQCQRAFILRRIDGLEYKQIANRMNISVSAVEKHVTNGVLKCSAYMRARGIEPADFGGEKKQKKIEKDGNNAPIEEKC